MCTLASLGCVLNYQLGMSCETLPMFWPECCGLLWGEDDPRILVQCRQGAHPVLSCYRSTIQPSRNTQMRSLQSFEALTTALRCSQHPMDENQMPHNFVMVVMFTQWAEHMTVACEHMTVVCDLFSLLQECRRSLSATFIWWTAILQKWVGYKTRPPIAIG